MTKHWMSTRPHNPPDARIQLCDSGFSNAQTAVRYVYDKTPSGITYILIQRMRDVSESGKGGSRLLYL